MIGAFTFNNIESGEYGLVCKSIKRPLLPAVKIKRVEISGRSGVYDFDENTEYDLRQIKMKITYKAEDFFSLRSRAREIAAWLAVNTWKKLIINDEPDKYYLAKVTEELDLETMLDAGSTEITFDCQPFAYSVEEQQVSFVDVTESAILSVLNPGTRHINNCSPVGAKWQIKIEGSWEKITIFNSRDEYRLTFSEGGTNSILVIDNIEMSAYMDELNKFSSLEDDFYNFLTLYPGRNTFGLDLHDLTANVAVTFTFIPLWL